MIKERRLSLNDLNQRFLIRSHFPQNGDWLPLESTVKQIKTVRDMMISNGGGLWKIAYERDYFSNQMQLVIRGTILGTKTIPITIFPTEHCRKVDNKLSVRWSVIGNQQHFEDILQRQVLRAVRHIQYSNSPKENELLFWLGEDQSFTKIENANILPDPAQRIRELCQKLEATL